MSQDKTNIPGIPLLLETPEVDLIWSYNGVSVEFDMTDVDTRKHYMACVQRMNEREKATPKDGETDSIVRCFCKLLRDFLDDLFGEGMGAKFVDRDSQARAQNCFASLNNFVRRQLDSTMAASAELSARAQGTANREQRRAAAKGKGKA